MSRSLYQLTAQLGTFWRAIRVWLAWSLAGALLLTLAAQYSSDFVDGHPTLLYFYSYLWCSGMALLLPIGMWKQGMLDRKAKGSLGARFFAGLMGFMFLLVTLAHIWILAATP